MHDPAPIRWQLRTALAVTNRLAERPGPDGIRWGLVARVKAEIAAGTYDTPARWALVEERLLRAAGGE